MRLLLAFFALCALASPSLAAWHIVHRDGYNYPMPPASCLVGRLPPYSIVLISQADMDAAFIPPGTPARIHLFGKHSHADGRIVIYIVDDLPPRVARDVLAHEQAHLRGCEHGAVLPGLF